MPGSTEHGRRNMLKVALASDRRLIKQRTMQMIDGAVEVVWPGGFEVVATCWWVLIQAIMSPRRPRIYNVIAWHDCWAKSSTTRWMAVIKLLSCLCDAARRCLPSGVSIALSTQTMSKKGTSRPRDLVCVGHGMPSWRKVLLCAAPFLLPTFRLSWNLKLVLVQPLAAPLLPSMLEHLTEYVKIGIGRQYASSRPSYCGQRDSS